MIVKGARSFNQPLNNWNVSKCYINMKGMFPTDTKFILMETYPHGMSVILPIWNACF